MEKTLKELQPGESGVVYALENEGSMRKRLLDIGLIFGTRVECVGKSPFGDPSAYSIRGAIICLRAKESRQIKIRTP